MAHVAKQIDFLAAGLNDPDTGESWNGAIVVCYEPGTSTQKAVWEDYSKTLPTVAGKSSFNLNSNGQATVFGDGYYDIKVYASTDTYLTTPIYTIEDAYYAISTADGTADSYIVYVDAEIDYVSLADPGTDHTTEIETAITTAQALMKDTDLAGFGNTVYVSLAGPHLISEQITIPEGIILIDGMLVADTTGDWDTGAVADTDWPSIDTPPADKVYMLYLASNNSGLRDIKLECNHVCNGIYVDEANRTGIKDIYIHGFFKKGLRMYGSCTDSHVENVMSFQYYFGETNWNDPTFRTGVGISVESADTEYYNCKALYCKFPKFIKTDGGNSIVNCHDYNGYSVSGPDDYTITGVVDNGSGLVQITVDDATGISDNDLIILPWLTGVSNGDGIKPGVHTVINKAANTFDISGSTFSGTYTGTGQRLMRWLDEPVCIWVDSTSSHTRITNQQCDNGKIVIESTERLSGIVWIKDEPTIQISQCYQRVDNDKIGYPMCGMELLANATINVPADFEGLTVTNLAGNGVPLFRISAINSGVLADDMACSISGNIKANGKPAPAYGQQVVDGGTTDLPGIIFTRRGSTDFEDEAGTTTYLDRTTGILSDDADKISVAIGTKEHVVFNEYGASSYVIRNIASGNAVPEELWMDADGGAVKADANSGSTSNGELLFCVASGSFGGTNPMFLKAGTYIAPAATYGAPKTFYVAKTPGSITSTKPSDSGNIVRVIGHNSSSTVFHFNPSNDYIEIG